MSATTDRTHRATWLHVPSQLAVSSAPPFFVPALFASVPVLIHLHRLRPTGRVELAVAGGALLGAWIASTFPRLLLVAGATTGLITYVSVEASVGVDRSLGTFLGVATVLWSLILGVSRPGWRRTTEPELFAPAAVPLVGASILLVVFDGTRVPAVLLAIACLGILIALVVPDAVRGLVEPAASVVRAPFSKASDHFDSFGRAIGRVIGMVAMVPVSAFVGLVWAAQRITRFDVLTAQLGPTDQWQRRGARDTIPERQYGNATLAHTVGFLGRVHRSASGVVLVIATALALIAAGAPGPRQILAHFRSPQPATTVDVIEAQGDEVTQDCATVGPSEDPVMDRDPGWPRIACETTEFATRGRFAAATTYEFPDYEGKWLNVKGGVRKTWKPPECSCRRIKVWWFGGSAAWGYWQRDEFSLPSQLAKAAWAAGIALDVENRAMPGWVLGQEVRKFAELTTTETPPDVVMFYDGGNELNRQKDRNQEGRGADESQTSFAEVEVDSVLRNGPFPWGKDVSQRPSSWPRSDSVLPPAEVAVHAVNRYGRDIELARRLAASVGSTPMFFWQPLLPSSAEVAGDRSVMTPEDAAAWAAMLPAAFDRLPAGVVNLKGSLDSVDEAVFKDVWHTNELGADVVGRDIVARVAGDLRALPPR